MNGPIKNSDLSWWLVFICWMLAVASTAGSLFFSEVMNFPPCSLCWYQRIFTYPLVILILPGLIPFDPKVIKYALPLVIVGWCITFYHNLLYYKFIPESAAPCSQGVSCTTSYIEWFGFVSIPLLSLLNFSISLILLIIAYRKIYR